MVNLINVDFLFKIYKSCLCFSSKNKCSLNHKSNWHERFFWAWGGGLGIGTNLEVGEAQRNGVLYSVGEDVRKK